MREVTDEEKQAALKAIYKLFDLWEVRDAKERLLNEIPIDAAKLDADQMERLAAFLKIHKSLRELFDETQAVAWVNKPNQQFENMSAIQIMEKEGRKGICRVLRYLETVNAN